MDFVQKRPQAALILEIVSLAQRDQAESGAEPHRTGRDIAWSATNGAGWKFHGQDQMKGEREERVEP